MPARENPPESGRCARCHENTVLELVPCEDCKGSGHDGENRDGQLIQCLECKGQGFTLSTPCCGATLVDEGAACDEAYERGRSEGWGA